MMVLTSLQHSQVLQAVLRHVDWSLIKCLVIAGPGFAKDQFKQFLEAEAVRRDIRCSLRVPCLPWIADLVYRRVKGIRCGCMGGERIIIQVGKRISVKILPSWTSASLTWIPEHIMWGRP